MKKNIIKPEEVLEFQTNYTKLYASEMIKQGGKEKRLRLAFNFNGEYLVSLGDEVKKYNTVKSAVEAFNEPYRYFK